MRLAEPVRAPLVLPRSDAPSEWSVWPLLLARMAGMPFDWIDIPATGDYSADRAAADQAMDAMARRSRFARAVLWQNPSLAATKLGRRYPPPKPTDGRYLRRSLWAYASRYCAKNDMIGYFGPVVWATWSTADTDIGSAGRPPIRTGVFFEFWAVRAVADALVTRHGLLPWMAPRLAAALRPVPGGIRLADGTTLRLSPARSTIVDACDGRRTAQQLAAELGPVDDELDALRRMGILTQELHVVRGPNPERALRGQLLRVTDPARRNAALADLDELCAARDRVALAVDDYDALAQALSALDKVFATVAGQEATRRDGEFYAGRTVVYPDCVGDISVRLGGELMTRIAPALHLILDSARWFCNRIADDYQGWMVSAIERLSAEYPHGVPLLLLVSELADTVVPGSSSPPADSAADELRRRWGALLVPDPTVAEVRHTSADLRGAVDTQFATGAPGWATARWHSPDLMLSCPSYADLVAGRYVAVLGELHPSILTIDNVPTYTLCPEPDTLRRLTDDLMGDDRVVPLYQLRSGLLNSRTQPPDTYLSTRSVYLGFGREPGYHPTGARMLAVSDLVAEVRDGRPRIRSAESGADYDPVAVLGEFFSHALAQRFGLLPRWPHTPRVVIDDLVVHRETWRIERAELGDLNQPAPTWYEHVQTMRARLGLPRHVFATVAGERKPFHVDLANPLSLAVLVHRLRRRDGTGARLTVTEMLPGPDGLWLTDDEGQRYTVEFRFTCEDRRRS